MQCFVSNRFRHRDYTSYMRRELAGGFPREADPPVTDQLRLTQT